MGAGSKAFCPQLQPPLPKFSGVTKKVCVEIEGSQNIHKENQFFFKDKYHHIVPQRLSSPLWLPLYGFGNIPSAFPYPAFPPHFARCCLQSFASWGLKKESLADDLKPGCFGEEVFKKKPRFVPIACSQNEHTERIKGLMF